MEQLKEFIQRNARFLSFLSAFFILLVFYHVRSGLTFFDPTYINWLIDDPELASGYFSFGYFRNQEWEVPIGVIHNYFYPLGTNIYMSDIPLLALFFKPLSPLLPQTFQYAGMWYLLCHLLQAWFTILLCERFGIKGLSRILVIIFLLFPPILMARYIHPSLFSQWMILAGFWIYFLDPEKVKVRKILFYQLFLFLVSGLEFAYMWAMVFGFSVALFLRLWLIDKKLSFFKALSTFSLQMAIMIGLWLLTGLISFDGLPNYQMSGWGNLSLNLNSPFNPMGIPSILPSLPHFIDQDREGYGYFGAGIILLIIIVVSIHAFRIVTRKTSGYRPYLVMEDIHVLPLLLFLLFAIVYALSNRVTINETVLFEYPVGNALSGILNSFRSSGRFFWPTYYFVFIILFYSINRLNVHESARIGILSACLALQLFDIKHFLRPLNITNEPINITYKKYSPPINKAWENVIGAFSEVLFYPGFRRTYLTQDDYRYFAYYTTPQNKKINVGYPARFDAVRTNELITELGKKIGNEGLNDSTLYISFDPDLNYLVVPTSRNEAYCFRMDGYIAIFKRSSRNKALADYLEQKGIHDEATLLRSKLLLAPWSGFADSLDTSLGRMGFYEADVSDDHFFMKGWAFLEESADPGNDSIFAILESTTVKQRWIAPAHRFATSDVAGFFGRPELKRAGFGISLMNSNLSNGSYHVGLLFTNRHSGRSSLFWLEHYISVNRAVDPFITEKPKEGTLHVKLGINVLEESGKAAEIVGWAFPEAPCRGCVPYFLLSSAGVTYAVEATHFARPDAVSFFNDTSLLNSGLRAKVNTGTLQKGFYRLGILFKDPTNRKAYFAESNRVLRVKVDEFSPVAILASSPQGADSIRVSIDRIDDKKDFFEIAGWGFINSVDTEGSTPYLVLKSSNVSYKIGAEKTYRPDVSGYFKLNFNTDYAGFTAKIKKDKLKRGTYKVCVLMVNLQTGTETLSCLEMTIEI